MPRKPQFGSIYRRGSLCWIKYYKNGEPVYESSESCKYGDAQRLRFDMLERVAQGLALEQLGDQVGLAILVPGIVHDEDVRVVQRAGGARFLLESSQLRGIVLPERKHLDGDRSRQALVAGSEDPAHAAAADLVQDQVAIPENHALAVAEAIRAPMGVRFPARKRHPTLPGHHRAPDVRGGSSERQR